MLERYRGRGLARTLVGEAVERLRTDGSDPILVVANDNDTVKHLYSRLGFDEVRRRWSFWRPVPW